MKRHVICDSVVGLVLAAIAAGCSGSGDASPPAATGSAQPAAASPAAPSLLAKYPGTPEGAHDLVTDVRTASNALAMTRALEPTSADYAAVFDGAAAAKAEHGYKALWSDPNLVLGADPENTALLIYKATTDDIKQWTPQVQNDFPGGYRRVGAMFKPGLTVYYWKYVKPGEALGMSYDGLIYVNGHWALFPKPWRVLGGDGPAAEPPAPPAAPAAMAAPSAPAKPKAKPTDPRAVCKAKMAQIHVTATDSGSCFAGCRATAPGNSTNYVCESMCRSWCH